MRNVVRIMSLPTAQPTNAWLFRETRQTLSNVNVKLEWFKNLAGEFIRLYPERMDPNNKMFGKWDRLLMRFQDGFPWNILIVFAGFSVVVGALTGLTVGASYVLHRDPKQRESFVGTVMTGLGLVIAMTGVFSVPLITSASVRTSARFMRQIMKKAAQNASEMAAQ